MILYVGLDDSNHAGRTKGEIIVATFSLEHKNSVFKGFPNRRKRDKAKSFFQEQDNDYRFTILMHETVSKRSSSLNLAVSTYPLIESYLEQTGLEIDKLKVYLDGQLGAETRIELRENLRPLCVDTMVTNNIKKTPLRMNNLLYIADIQASNLFRDNTVAKLFRNDKFVPIPIEKQQ